MNKYKKKLSKVLAILTIFFIVGLIFGAVFSFNVQADWWNPSWRYRQTISISNSGSTTNDFQTQITFDSTTLIPSKMQSDCDDLRFTDLSGNMLSYWLEPGSCNTATTIVWVKIPEIPNGGRTILMYYGNESAISESNSTRVFVRQIDKLEGAWDFDETSWSGTPNEVNERSGNNYDGTATNATISSTALFGNAGNFDGTDDFVQTNHTTNYTDALTLSFWVRPTAIPAVGDIGQLVSKSSYFATSATDFPLGVSINDSGNVSYFTSAGDDFSVDSNISSTTTLSTGQWYHVAAVYSANDIVELYINGTRESFANITHTISTNSRNWTFGRAAFENGGGVDGSDLNGRLDDMRVFNKALTQDEIDTIIGDTNGDHQLYSTENYPNRALVRQYNTAISAGTPTGEEEGESLRLYHSFDQISGQTSFDSASQRNDGQLGSTAGIDVNDPLAVDDGRCVAGKCMYFDSNDSIEISDDVSLDVENTFTASAWFKTGDKSTQRAIIGQGGETAGNLGFNFNIETDGRIRCWRNTNGSNPIVIAYSPSIDYADNKWHHAVCVADGSNLTVYVDAQAGTPTALSGDLFDSTDNLYIGWITGGGTTWYWNGFLDEVKIFGSALSYNEILSEYNLGGSALGSFGQSSLSSGLDVYYPMDESVPNTCGTSDSCDRSGSNYHGEWNGDATSTTGKFNNGVNFDGTDDYIVTSNTKNYTDEFTISTWINMNALPSVGTIGQIITKNSYFAASITDFPVNIQVSNTGIVGYTTSQGDDFIDDSVLSSTTSLTTGEWYHITATYKANQYVELYINGEKEASSEIDFFISTNTRNWTMGRTAFENGGGVNASDLNGKLDEVRIYNRTLSANEIQSLYEFEPGSIPDSPVTTAEWKFDEQTGQTTFDSNGSNNGQLGSSSGSDASDPTWLNATNCISNSCLDFNSDYVEVNDFDFSDNDEFSISTWFYLDTAPSADHTIITKEASGFTSRVFRIYIDNATSNIVANIGDGATSYTTLVTSSTVVQTNQWYHIAFSYDSNTARLYVNGALDNATNNSQTVIDNSTSIRIGSAHDSGFEFPGRIDEVKIYNYGLSETQVVKDYNINQTVLGSFGSIEATTLEDGIGNPPVVHIPFDDKSSSTALDKSGNGNNATLTGSPSWGQNKETGTASISLNGSTQYASLPDNILDSYNTGTVSTWFKWENNGSYQVLFSYTDDTVTDYIYSLQITTSGNIEQVLRLTGTNQFTSTSVMTLSENQWYHVAATNDGSNYKIYLNGTEIQMNESASGTGTEGLWFNDIPNAENATIGAMDRASVVFYFQGEIDDLKIYDFALSQAQVSYEYNRGKPTVHLKFNEVEGSNAYDSSGNGITGTLSNLTRVSGKYSNAYQFAGNANSYVQLSDNDIHTPNQITLSAWFKTSTTGTIQTIFGKDDLDGCPAERSYFLRINSANLLEIVFFADCSNAGTISGVDFESATGTTTVTDGQWHHVAATWNGTNIRMYLDGKLEASRAFTGTVYNSTSDLYIGRQERSGLEQPFNGIIDDIRIYNYALSEEQVIRLKNNDSSVWFSPVE